MSTQLAAELVDNDYAGVPVLDGGAVLAATGIVKSYRRGVWPIRREARVLRGVELVLRPGETVGLVGENGSGKSTLMKILVGALRADAGGVSRAGRLGYCPQEPLVYDRLSCDEHFELFGRAYGLPAEVERAARAQLYATLGFERYAATRADQLSGGTWPSSTSVWRCWPTLRCCCSMSRTPGLTGTPTSGSGRSWPSGGMPGGRC